MVLQVVGVRRRTQRDWLTVAVASPTGTIVVEGHELHEEDIRLMYTFDQTTGGTTQYEAHSDAQVCLFPTPFLYQKVTEEEKVFTCAFPEC